MNEELMDLMKILFKPFLLVQLWFFYLLVFILIIVTLIIIVEFIVDFSKVEIGDKKY